MESPKEKAMHERFLEKVVEVTNRDNAIRCVVANKGAPGIDKMEVSRLEEHMLKHWEVIRAKLLEGRWTPNPVRRVTIPKPGGGERELGIPSVVDRTIQQMLLQKLQPIFESGFSEYSYGFRPGRSAHDAVRTAQGYVKEGKTWMVDIDISKFFDHVHHDILICAVRQKVKDKLTLRLIARYLRAGAMLNGVCIRSDEGTPQGGPLSPLLGNIYLDALDKELEKRGLSFVRYADDCNIYVQSQRAAKRVYEHITGWITKTLRLQVNERKSGIGRPWERKFLGFRITQKGEIEISPESIQHYRESVRELWSSCQSLRSVELRNRWRAFVRGWWNYYHLGKATKYLPALDGWTRRHIRKCFWLRWHNKQGRLRRLLSLGASQNYARLASSSRGAWRIAACPILNRALSNTRLRHHGFLVIGDFSTV